MDLQGIRYGLLIKILHRCPRIQTEKLALTCCSNHLKMIWRYGHIGATCFIFYTLLTSQSAFYLW